MLIGYHVGNENASHLVKRMKKAFASERPDTIPGRWGGLVLRNRSLVREKRGENDLKI